MEKQNVKMKVSEMIKAYTGLTAVVGEKKLFPGEVNLAIAKNYKILGDEMKAYNKSVNSLVEEYVHKDSKGEPEIKEVEKGSFRYIFETNEKEKMYVKAIEELQNTEMEVEVNMISDSSFDTGNEQPTAFDFISMEFMIRD